MEVFHPILIVSYRINTFQFVLFYGFISFLDLKKQTLYHRHVNQKWEMNVLGDTLE